MDMLKEVCNERNIRLCLDCISSIGTVPVSLEGVYLASGVSGKGLRSYPGLSMVFSDHEFIPAPKALPRYLDPGLHLARNGVPFTLTSNLVYALRTALEQFESEERIGQIADISVWLRLELAKRGFQMVSPDSHASPAVVTIEIPEEVSSGKAGQLLEEAGYLLSYNSDYLLQRNWMQICPMGGCSRETLLPLLDMMRKILDQANSRD
jgi:aspartate aminotransferase-like enzyme